MSTYIKTCDECAADLSCGCGTFQHVLGLPEIATSISYNIHGEWSSYTLDVSGVMTFGGCCPALSLSTLCGADCATDGVASLSFRRISSGGYYGGILKVFVNLTIGAGACAFELNGASWDGTFANTFVCLAGYPLPNLPLVYSTYVVNPCGGPGGGPEAAYVYITFS